MSVIGDDQESSEIDSEEERAQVKQDVIKCFEQRKEPLTVAQLSYTLKYRKAYLEELLPQMEEIKGHSLNDKHKVYCLQVPRQITIEPKVDL